MNRSTLTIRLLILATFAAAVWGRALAAPDRVSHDFLARMETMEKATGQPNRMTLYARIADMALPLDIDEKSDEWRALVSSQRNPFSTDISPLLARVDQFEPAFALILQATSVKVSELPKGERIYTVPSVFEWHTSGRLLCVRAQNEAAHQAFDSALRDLCGVWILGDSLEHCSNSPSVISVVGDANRRMALRQLINYVERFDVTPAQAQMLLGIALEPRGGWTVVDGLAFEVSEFAEMTLEANTKKTEPLASVTADHITKVRDRWLALYHEMKKANSYPQSMQMLKAFEEPPPVSSIADQCALITRAATGDAYENILFTGCWLIVHSSDTGGKTTSSRMATAEASEAARFLDPFTGAPLRVEDLPNGGFMIRSTGPDCVFSTGAPDPFDPSKGVDSPGDLILRYVPHTGPPK